MVVKDRDIVETVVAHIKVDSVVAHTTNIVVVAVLHQVVVEIGVYHDMRNFKNCCPCQKNLIDPSILDHRNQNTDCTDILLDNHLFVPSEHSEN